LKNKEKILHSSLRLFNQNGFVNVRLQHISDDTIISVGNIAYHFKNKEAIVQALFLEWEKRIKEVLIEYRHTPIFESMDRIFLSMESLQEEYRFFFSDILEIKRSYPDFFEQIQQVYQYQVMAFQEIIRFNIARGAMQKLEEPQLHFLSHLVVHHLHHAPTRNLLHQVETLSTDLSSFIWGLLNPYLSDSGKSELSIYIHKRITLEE